MRHIDRKIILVVLAAVAFAWLMVSTAHQSAYALDRNGSGPFDDRPPSNRPPAPGGGFGGGRNSPVVQLGKAIFFDTNISNPSGMSCARCHSPAAGFSYPDSYVNRAYGTVPGAISDRFGSRKPMTISYAWFVPDGQPFWNRRQHAWMGGFFADGRADDLEDQATMPMTNPNEMNNVLHGLASTDTVVKKISTGSYTSLFKSAFGNDALSKPASDILPLIRQAIFAYERSREVSPFSSKYDAYADGLIQLSPSEMNGLRLFTGSVSGRPGGVRNYKSAQCSTCHTIADSDLNNPRRDFFTNWTYANIGVPKNPRNRYYRQTTAATNPQGFNPLGDRFIDLGLGAVLYPNMHLPPGNMGPGSDGRGDFLQINGEFRVASLRNVDKRPSPSFVKCYMHNGFFKSLKDVVHFYNTRNLTRNNQVIDLTASADGPAPTALAKPLWPAPEYASPLTLQNPAGRPNSPGSRVGNLGLTDQEENDIVAFLGTLSDGYFTPQRRPPPGN